MNTKIWLEELSFGPNFGNLHPIGSSRVWWYFLAHIFKINKVWIDFIKRFPRYSKVGINFIRLFLRKSSCVPVQISEFRFPLYAAFNYLYPFLIFSVHKFCVTDIFRKFSFFLLLKNIYRCLYLSRLFFKFHAPVTKVSIPFFPYWK